VGGFTLPFFAVGSTSLVLGFCLCLVVPDIESDKDEDNNNKENAESLDKKLTFMKIIGVRFNFTLVCHHLAMLSSYIAH
jgi:hypothetical protein